MQSDQVYHFCSKLFASLAVLSLECSRAPLVLLGHNKTSGATSDDIADVAGGNHSAVLPQLIQLVQQYQ